MSSSSGSATRFTSAWSRATSSANDPQPLKPGWVCRSQTCWLPLAHSRHEPQATTNGTVTRSPTDQRVTAPPTSATVPASSWPGTCGRAMVSSCPAQACQSLRHRPVASTRTTTPWSGATGSGTSRTVAGPPNCSNTTARMAQHATEACCPTRGGSAAGRQPARVEPLEPHDGLEHVGHLAAGEVAVQVTAGEHIAEGAHDHALVEAEVALGDLTALDGDRVVEAARAVGVEVAAQLRQVGQGGRPLVGQREERRVRRDHPVAEGRLRLRHPLGAALVATVDAGALLVRGVAVGVEADLVYAVPPVATGRVAARGEAPVAVAGLVQAVLHLRLDGQRVVDPEGRLPPLRLGHEQVGHQRLELVAAPGGHELQPAVLVGTLEDVDPEV